MKPDPHMMRMAMSSAKDALDAIGRFQVSAGFAFGRDGSHISSYQSVRDLADALHNASAKLNHAALEADERLTPAARINKK